ncbi:transcription initiation factor IIB [Halococcus thailandensis]|uniref:Transcription initiation factor IIB n=1 Tax=Halococcus thailandensis JCM 13552 TaxID=1227457 RepID=M0NHB2_9EURY|nr:TFIIB-type zinc ribbon-containing protein [Halococcus thailandensis]EMA56015.1 transcription factor TFIIB cyclin-related protein [Halococcus thailandensis JCM 13552]
MVDTRQTEREVSKDSTDTTETEHTTTEQTLTTCPECDGRLEDDHKHGETACVECGFVVDENEIDHGPEWRSHTADEREQRSRVGSPTTKMLHDDGVSSEIGWRNVDAYGNSLSSRQRQKMNRLRTWHTRSKTTNPQERNLKHALGEIKRMASALGLPQSTRETASVIYRRALDDDLLRGRSIEGMSTAAVYAAARQAGIPRSLDEVTAVSRIKQLRITRTYRHLTRELGLEIEPADPLDYIPRLVSDLDLSEAAEQRSRDLLTTVIETEEHYLSGKNPVGLAAAAVYAGALLTNEKVTQQAVGEVADISKPTIRNRYQDLIEIGEDLQVP